MCLGKRRCWLTEANDLAKISRRIISWTSDFGTESKIPEALREKHFLTCSSSFGLVLLLATTWFCAKTDSICLRFHLFRSTRCWPRKSKRWGHGFTWSEMLWMTIAFSISLAHWWLQAKHAGGVDGSGYKRRFSWWRWVRLSCGSQ